MTEEQRAQSEERKSEEETGRQRDRVIGRKRDLAKESRGERQRNAGILEYWKKRERG